LAIPSNSVFRRDRLLALSFSKVDFSAKHWNITIPLATPDGNLAQSGMQHPAFCQSRPQFGAG
jgi:hypothetical protein